MKTPDKSVVQFKVINRKTKKIYYHKIYLKNSSAQFRKDMLAIMEIILADRLRLTGAINDDELPVKEPKGKIIWSEDSIMPNQIESE